MRLPAQAVPDSPPVPENTPAEYIPEKHILAGYSPAGVDILRRLRADNPATMVPEVAVPVEHNSAGPESAPPVEGHSPSRGAGTIDANS